MTTFPKPELTPASQPYWEGMAAGELRFQRCLECGHAWLPPRSHCPSCLKDHWTHEASSGKAILISWIVYHRAFHESVADSVPYNVAIVELEEGPRLISNVVDDPAGERLRIGQPLQVVFEERDEVAVPLFVTGGTVDAR